MHGCDIYTVSDCLETKRDGLIFLNAVRCGAGDVFKRVQISQGKKLSYVPWLTNLKTTASPGKVKRLKGTRLQKESVL